MRVSRLSTTGECGVALHIGGLNGLPRLIRAKARNLSEPESVSESNKRPHASGHRFGPDLTCSECGVTWDNHQKDPIDCARPDAVPVLDRDDAKAAPVPARGGEH